MCFCTPRPRASGMALPAFPMPSRPCPGDGDDEAMGFLRFVYNAPPASREEWERARGLMKAHLQPHLRDIEATRRAFELFATSAAAMAAEHTRMPDDAFIAVFKERSRAGLDLIRGRDIDYGNLEYKAFAVGASLKEERARNALEEQENHEDQGAGDDRGGLGEAAARLQLHRHRH